jgi:hypothetical protein
MISQAKINKDLEYISSKSRSSNMNKQHLITAKAILDTANKECKKWLESTLEQNSKTIA